jgi:hypothetical protein
MGSRVLYTPSTLLSDASLIVTGVTGKDGAPLRVSSPSPLMTRGESTSIGNYLFNLKVDSIDVIADLSSFCLFDSYKTVESLVAADVTAILSQSLLADVLPQRVQISPSLPLPSFLASSYLSKESVEFRSISLEIHIVLDSLQWIASAHCGRSCLVWQVSQVKKTQHIGYFFLNYPPRCHTIDDL